MSSIRPRPVEDLGVTLPPIGQGTMGVGGYYQRDSRRDAEWIAGLRHGIHAGLTLIDTAEVYGDGHSEELVGQAMNGLRNEVFLSTKFSAEHSRAPQIIAAAEGSLRRLATDWIDLYQPHWPNPSVPFEETAMALSRLVQSGKVRHVGLSNFSVNEFRAVADRFEPLRVRILQHEYNLIDRTIEDQLLPLCRSTQSKVLAYSPFLQGKMVPNDSRKHVLERLADKYHSSLAQIILAWMLRDECIVVIPKGSSGTHIQELAAVRELELDSEDIEMISETYCPRVRWVPVSHIFIQGGGYRTEQEARENHLGFDPSPQALAESLWRGDMLKPLKVKCRPGEESYILMEGKIRYWAWVLAYTSQSSIPVFVEDEAWSREMGADSGEGTPGHSRRIHPCQIRTGVGCV